MYTLLKRNKRLFIVDETGTAVYTPPDFLRHKIRSRDQLKAIVDVFNDKESYVISAIIDFESSFW